MKRIICCFALFCFAFISLEAQMSKMSLEEKAQCVVGIKRKDFPTPTNNGIPGRTAALPSLNIPSLVLADGSSGIRLSRKGEDRSTAFPSNTSVASSWNQDLAREIGATVGKEALHYGVNIMLAPGMNIIRNPLCGRNFEYYSEDPLVSGKMAAGYVNGLQEQGVAACFKHFICNNQETNRTHVDTRVSARALQEIYLRGYRICIAESNPWAAMSSYNSLNGIPVQEDRHLLTDILSGELGFSGILMTDWGLVPHNTVAQIHAGNDLLMPGLPEQKVQIIEGVRSGSLPEEDLDTACDRMIALAKKCSMSLPSEMGLDLKGDAIISRKAAGEGAVLLRNTGMLPLSVKEGGSAALFGVRSYDLIPTGDGCAYVPCAYVSQISEAFKSAGVQIDRELEELYLKYVDFADADIAYNERIKIRLSLGKPAIPELDIARVFIGKAAKRNDYAVITIGRTSVEGTDRKLDGDYYLSKTEEALIKNVCKAFHAEGKKVAVVLNIASIIEMESWKDLPDAILNVWLPGQEGGNVVCDLLSGKENPSGRLALTIPMDYFDVPSAYDYPYNQPTSGKNYDYTEYTEGIYVGYRHFCTKGTRVTYPFGYGLSYTSFTYSGLKVKSVKDKVSISVTITNSGSVPGKEAIGAYVSAPAGKLDKPSAELKAFAKTGLLAPGQSETIRMVIPASLLASFNENTGKWETARGRYRLGIGADVTSPALVSEFSRK